MNNFKFQILGLLILFSACKTTSKVQQPIASKHLLSVELKANKEYFSINDMQVSTKVLMPEMDAMEQNQSTYTESRMKVSQGDVGKKIITTTFDTMTMNFTGMPGMDNPAAPDVRTWRIDQHLTNDNTMVLDSISGMEATYQGVIEQMLEATMRNYNLDFPEQGMAVNDTFIEVVPFEMDMPGGMGNIKIDIRTKYTLASINSEDALFNTSIDITGTLDMMGITGTLDMIGEASDILGKGTGTTTLDRKGQYIKEVSNVINQDINMNMMGQSMTTSTTTTTSVKVKMKEL